MQENKEYQNLLIKKAKWHERHIGTKAMKDTEFYHLSDMLLKMELKMTIEEILFNTKIAFPNPPIK